MPLTTPTSSLSTPPTVLMDDRALDLFLGAAVAQYDRLTPDTPLPCFALLLGHVRSGSVHIEDVAFGRNARTSDPAARREFTEAIPPRFGPSYENETRGWWFDSRDLLAISRQAEDEGLEVLGSIHMHPDWHRIGPPQERDAVLSERPTPMDAYLFRGTGWPVNIICYLERRNGTLFHALGAWAPLPEGSPELPCPQLSLRVGTSGPRVPCGAEATV
ncbi:hypothetical protein [Streptomyces sp. NPDC051776]|uniref:hypothetical protein n=1 Tax=Streptomyces sp. NPDC051776 TaxID=3155414 RepID=UPI00342C8928